MFQSVGQRGKKLLNNSAISMAAESYKNNSKVKTGQEFKFKILVCKIRSIFNKTENF